MRPGSCSADAQSQQSSVHSSRVNKPVSLAALAGIRCQTSSLGTECETWDARQQLPRQDTCPANAHQNLDGLCRSPEGALPEIATACTSSPLMTDRFACWTCWFADSFHTPLSARNHSLHARLLFIRQLETLLYCLAFRGALAHHPVRRRGGGVQLCVR